MMNLANYNHCIQTTKGALVVCSENQSKYTLINGSKYEISKIQIDGCVFNQSDGEKCDYVLKAVKGDDKLLFLIELKGNDVLKAVSQVNSSLGRLNIGSQSGFNKIFGRIVPTKVYAPDIRTTKFLALKDKFKQLKGDLKCVVKNSDII